jgi:molybdopterin-biosynthesis enzyme MoeA-like protein
VLTVPDDRRAIARSVREWTETFDAVVVTGGLGGTPDDVTKAAVAQALDRDLVVDPDARADVEAKARAFVDEHPDLVDRFSMDVDLDATASVPAGARPLLSDESFGPGFVVENVYVFPGVPEELRAMFEQVAAEFGGDVVSETIYTPAPEGALNDRIAAVRDRFGVAVGSYPGRGETPGRLKLTGTDAETVAAAAAWLRAHVETVDGE